MTPAQLLAARKSLRASQAALADQLGVDVVTVSRWERGAYPIPPYLGLAIKYLLTKRKGLRT